MKFLILLFILAGCAKPIEVGPIDSSPIDKIPPEPVLVEHPAVLQSPSWEKGHPERLIWSERTRSVVQMEIAKIETARDRTRFCPKYDTLSNSDRIAFWTEFVSVMAYFESGWKPQTVFKEPPPLNNESIGLLQLSVSDAKNYPFCAPVASRSAIMDPLKNLDCGVRILAKWIAKDSAITTTANGGGARYWSVLREKRKLPEVLAKLKAGTAYCK